MNFCWSPISLIHWLACKGGASLLLLGRTSLHQEGKRSHGHIAGARCRQAWAFSCGSHLAPTPPPLSRPVLRKDSWQPAPSWMSNLFLPLLIPTDTGCLRHGMRSGQACGDPCPHTAPPAAKDLQPPPEAEVVPCNGRVNGRLLLPAHIQLRE